MSKVNKSVEIDVSIGLAEEDFPGCCGITVFHDFPLREDIEGFYDDTSRKAIFEAFIREVGTPENRLKLVSLIDDQLQDGWLSIVRDAGFKQLIRFRNGSGNIVTLFGQANTTVPPYKGKLRPKKSGAGG